MHRSSLCSLLLAFAAHLPAHESGPAMTGVQSLDIARSGDRLHLLLGETTTAGAEATLVHLTSNDDGATWSNPVRVDAGNKPAFGLHRGMDAQIAASGNHLVAVWQTAGTDSWGGGPMATALSSDAGLTWKPGPNPADDGSTAGHNFIDIAADGKGVIHLVWLDTRNGLRGLRSTSTKDFGTTWSTNLTVDKETCECCWNTLATSPTGEAWVIYRDKSPRDMTVATLGDSASKPTPVGPFQWEFPGCPHVGAGLSLAPDHSLHAAVWTGKDGRNGTYYLHSSGSSSTWSEPQKLGGDTARNPDCAAGADKTVAVVWNAASEHASPVHAALSTDGGTTWSKPKPVSTPDGACQHPRVIATPQGFRTFWTEIADKRIVWKSAALTASK